MTTIPATFSERIPLPPAGGPGMGEGGGISLGSIVGALRQRMVMIVLLGLFFSMIAIGLFFLAWIKFPKFSSEAWIEVISKNPRQAAVIQPAMHEDEHARFITSQAQLVTSPEVLKKVLATNEVKGTQWYKNTPEQDRLTELEDEIGSGAMRDTNYIRVVMACRNLKDPAIIVGKVVEAYMTMIQEGSKEEFRKQVDDFKVEEENLAKQITEKLKQIENYTSQLPAGVDYKEGNVISEQLKSYVNEVALAYSIFLELQGMYVAYNDPAGPPVTAENRQAVEQRPMVMALTNQLFAIDQEMDVLLEKFGTAHLEVRRLRERRSVIERQLAEQREQELTKILDFSRERIETAYFNAQSKLMALQDKQAEAEARQSDLDRKMAGLQTLKDELEMLKESRTTTREHIRELERIVHDERSVDVKVARYPNDPIARSSPNMLMLPAGIMIAFLLAAGLALLLEFTDTSVRTPADIVQHLSVALLGVVPDVDDEEVPIDQVETAVRDAPHSMIVEAFRTIRTSLQFSAPADRQRSIMVTSPKPEDGKTTIACNLAASLAQSGRRVLLVDANFRRPSIARFFTGNGDRGLSNLLIGEGNLEELVNRTDIANLDVLCSGPIPPNPAERLASPQVRDFLRAALAKYDQVIIDVPPVLLATDATVLATEVDGVILVCRAKENSRGIAQRACSLLTRVNAHIFGAVLNAAQTRRGGYFREQIAAFYDYQSSQALATNGRPALPKKNGDGTKAEGHAAEA